MTTTGPKTVRSISMDDLLAADDSRDIILETKSTKSLAGDELKAAKKENRFYLPVVYLNHMDMHPPKPNSERQHWTDEKAMETCLGNCCGVPGTKSMCCRMAPDSLEHVLGPLDEKWIKKMIAWLKKRNINVTRHDIVIDYEEGRIIGQHFFNGNAVFEKKDSYPIMRIQIEGPHFGCKFLNNMTRLCNIYPAPGEVDIRPAMCQDYLCGYVKSNFFVRSKEHPNTWAKVDVRPEEPEDEKE